MGFHPLSYSILLDSNCNKAKTLQYITNITTRTQIIKNSENMNITDINIAETVLPFISL
jgi:hypothetical protein